MRIRFVIAMLFILPVVEGCDFFRSLAGRPTAAEIATLMEADAAEQPCDTLEAVESPAPDLEPETDPWMLRAPETSYLVVAGCFRIPRHAQRCADRLRRLGYDPCIVSWRGLEAVGLCPTADKTEARCSLRHLRAAGVCPKGSWIMAQNN